MMQWITRKGVFIAGGFAVVLGILFLAPSIFRRVRNEILYRIPVALPGLPPCPDCNIILVNLDTLRPDNMPCYGYVRNTTPNLCTFAAKNILFDRFFTQSSFTLDSHMSIYTGMYPSTHHVVEALKDKLNPAIPTFTQLLNKRGYRTIWAGVTTDVNLPLDKGFERGFDEIHDLDGLEPEWKQKYEKLLPKLADGKPTFLFLHSYAPHSPYLPGNGSWKFATPGFPDVPVTRDAFLESSFPFYEYVLTDLKYRLSLSESNESQEYIARNIRDLESALKRRDLEQVKQLFWTFPEYEGYSYYIGWYWQRVDRGNPVMVSHIQDLYDERISQIDKDMQSLLEFVSRPEIKRKTILIILSDNGEDFLEHGDFDHGGHIYNTGTHAPFILSVPRVETGVFHQLVQAVDIYPSLLELVGIKQQVPVDGVSFLPILYGYGEQQVGERYLIGQHRGDDIVSIRNDRWKMYKNNTSKKHYVELYDLMTDPGEQKNILGDQLDIAGRLDQALTRILEASPKYASVSAEFPTWLDEEKRKSLIEEGYF